MGGFDAALCAEQLFGLELFGLLYIVGKDGMHYFIHLFQLRLAIRSEKERFLWILIAASDSSTSVATLYFEFLPAQVVINKSHISYLYIPHIAFNLY